MSRNLTVNTLAQRKWTPSPEMAIREEEDETAPQRKQQHFIEEEDEEEEEEEDDEEEDEEDEDSAFTSSPSIPDENINFDLVYTLHSFEATVDGQASVKKGDALTLLDDSNSYWWLIRDLKSSEVGYIPAENIETPFERLARLNKHRNVELTSMEQAAFYTNKDEKKKAKPNRKVVLSTSLAVQAQILLTGDDEDDIQDEAYETWEEEMLEDDDDDQGEKEDAENKADEEEQEKQKDPIKNSNKLDENGKDIKPERNNREEQQQMAANQSSSARVDPPVALQKDNIPNRVLRVYAGNVSVNASYHSVRVVESTTAAELLQQAMEKFRISEIESQQGASGLNDNSCVEYYLTIKQKDGDEITMEGKDKPWEIFESLTDHLTTPMPSLTKFRQLASSNTSINSTSSSKKKKKYHNMDHSIQFLMNKRIKRVNEKNGQVHIKVSLITPSVSLSTLSYSSIIGRNAIKKMTQFRRFTKKNKGGGASGNSNVGAITEVGERIDKLIAIPENISIADLTTTALVKFHILSEMNQPHQYRMVLQCDGKDTLLTANDSLKNVLKGLEGKEKCFTLHNFCTNSGKDEDRYISLSSSTSSSSSSSQQRQLQRPTPSKVYPEIKFYSKNNNNTCHQVKTRLDCNTESILKRLDAVLLAHKQNNPTQRAAPKPPSSMSVCRNESGIDVHLPHGLLRSTLISKTQTQYSLMTGPNSMVFQIVLPEINGHSQSTSNIQVNKKPISGEEMAALVEYGSQYLNTFESANKPQPILANTTLDRGESNLSSLDDLEKELQRIISSHSG